MSTETIEKATPVVAPAVEAIAEYSPVDAALATLEGRYAGVTFPVETTAGDKAARAARLELVGLRGRLEKKRKELKAPALAHAKLIDTEAERIKVKILALECPIDAQIVAQEQVKDADRQAKADAEKARVAGHKAELYSLRAIGTLIRTYSDESLTGALAHVAELNFDGLEEFRAEAVETARVIQNAIGVEIEQRKVRAAEDRKLAEERAELAKARREQAAREAEAAAKLAAERKVEQDRIAAERRVEQDRLLTERAAREAKQAEENRLRKIEVDRQQADLDRQRAELKAEQDRIAEVNTRERQAREARERPALEAMMTEARERETLEATMTGAVSAEAGDEWEGDEDEGSLDPLPEIALDMNEAWPYIFKPGDRSEVVCMLKGPAGEAERFGRLFTASPKLLAACIKAEKLLDALWSFWGQGLEVANWHQNGDTEPWDSFFENNSDGTELESLREAIAEATT